jgi:hypothetical protein
MPFRQSRQNRPGRFVDNETWISFWRSRRVAVLVAGIILLSLADLVITIAYLRANFMFEANPIAAHLIRSTQSPWALAAFKMATVGICVFLLLKLRRYRAGEVAAWCAVGILAVMSVMWNRYAAIIDEPHIMMVQGLVDDHRLGLP